MKKELLIASALVSTMGVASVAEAVTATTSGSHHTGLRGTALDTNADESLAQVTASSFSVSLSETTDGGVGIASSFMLANEGTTGLQTAGLTLTFTDGSKLDVIKAGNAAATHDVSVPGGAGEASITVTTTNRAQTGLDFFGEATAVGIEWHSAADFMADGLKISASASVDDGVAADGSAELESSWGVGATYVTSAGDTAVTVGAGLADSDWKDSGTAPSSGSNGYHIGFSAVTGNLTVAAGYASGDDVDNSSTTNNVEVSDNTVTKVGVKYVSGDVTLSVGYSAAEGSDSTTMGTAGSAADAVDTTDAGISYAVASGVTANLGWKNVDSSQGGSAETSGGTSWYIGANMAF
ncbi:porin [Pelagibacterales bacterium SAG-MED31]|nr:porin [Pelagibacterales bacterium SAG-MED31]